MPRTMRKGIRDLAVLGAAAVLTALAESAGDYGIPVEAVPVVSVAALAIYRLIRGALEGEPNNG
jgi:molybdenum cofactor biosynthesis enzyme